MGKDDFKKLPGIDKLLNTEPCRDLIKSYGHKLVSYALRNAVNQARTELNNTSRLPDIDQLISETVMTVKKITGKSLKPVINATGIILHTNLGRAPLGEIVLENIREIFTGYSNLEFDLATGRRGQRNIHSTEILRFVTNAEDTVVVNNNAAAVLLCLKTFASRKEVIISRGELIEIGGSFRIPDIMKTSGAKMVEVGTTNRTRLKDYQEAVTDRTSIIMKAHRSNFHISGFTEEVDLQKLSGLAHQHGLIMFYDLGSGLLRKPADSLWKSEPDVHSSLAAGVDLVSFSGDKLLGGPQAGIIAGRKDLIGKLAKSPLMRALRVDKLTISTLNTVASAFLDDDNLNTRIPLYQMLSRSEIEMADLAENLSSKFNKYQINNKIISSDGQVGGGTLPDIKLPGFAVQLIKPRNNKNFPEKMFKKLLEQETPILSVLREGNILFDVRTLNLKDFEYIAKKIASIIDHEI
ncbi:MAG: L-seryl-tRNA(Sec) selenium transferase [Candidatus Cloacimonetes bacterium]|nr:L-seryl-tRNA(Sec) selenium transferase [Candidatus Cloacimonadota bacterium]